MISVTNLSKSFGKKQVLNKVNLEFEPGKIYGVVGKNGAGKTTLFNCILGLESYSGSVNSTLGAIKDISGYLPTNPHFLSYITGKEYLQLLCNARDISIASFTSKNIFNLPLHQYAETYSTGMKKKLVLTAILLQKNEVFVLDEPFNGVDIESNILLNQILSELRRLNKTVILSSHIFSTLKDNCDLIYFLDNGWVDSPVEKNNFDSVESRLIGDGLDLKKLDVF